MKSAAWEIIRNGAQILNNCRAKQVRMGTVDLHSALAREASQARMHTIRWVVIMPLCSTRSSQNSTIRSSVPGWVHQSAVALLVLVVLWVWKWGSGPSYQSFLHNLILELCATFSLGWFTLTSFTFNITVFHSRRIRRNRRSIPFQEEFSWIPYCTGSTAA